MKLRRVLSLMIALLLTLSALPTVLAEEEVLYSIGVDLTNQIVTVYTVDGGDIVRQMITSTGAKETPTPTGTYTMPKPIRNCERQDWYYFWDGGLAHYATRIWNGYMFHSYLYRRTDENYVSWDTKALLGTPASHGCMRMNPDDAEWIAKNCPPGTKVKIYKSGAVDEYLRALLKVKSFYVEDGLSYSEFTGGASHDGELGYGSTGEQVRALQSRLSGLGLHLGAVTGTYDADMVETVSTLQEALGLTVNGKVNKGLWTLIFSDEAPTSDLAIVSLGATGPMVKYVQALLKKAALYEGGITGEFDAMTDVAVRAYQSYAGFEEDGVLTASQQEALIELIDELEMQYPGGYKLDAWEETRTMAKIATRAEMRLNVREKADKNSASLGQLKSGAIVRVLSTEGDWSEIEYDGKTGYLLSQYIDTYTETVQCYGFVAADNPVLKAIDPDDYAIDPFMDSVDVQIGTGSKKEVMVFYKEKSDDSDVAFGLLEGASIELDSCDDKWAKATYCGEEGYIQVSKLNITTEKRLATTVSGEEGEKKARNMGDTPVTVYANVSTSSDALGALEPGAEVDILKQGDSWAQIAFNGGFGYIEISSVQIGVLSEEMKAYVASVSHLLSQDGPIDGARAFSGASDLAAQIAGEESVPQSEGEIVDADGMAAGELTEEDLIDTSAARAAFDAADAEGDAFDFD